MKFERESKSLRRASFVGPTIVKKKISSWQPHCFRQVQLETYNVS